MARERFDIQKGNWVDASEVNAKLVAENVYDELGVRFPIQWEGVEPIVDSDDLPDGVKMSDVKNALKNNHPRI